LRESSFTANAGIAARTNATREALENMARNREVGEWDEYQKRMVSLSTEGDITTYIVSNS